MEADAEVARIQRAIEAAADKFNAVAREDEKWERALWEYDATTGNLRLNREKASLKPILFQTRYLLKEAAELQIPVPEDEIYWQFSHNQEEPRILTVDGVNRLRRDIRRERKERIDVLQTRLAIIFGTVGAITGTISLFISLTQGH